MHERGYEATGVAELCAAAAAPKGTRDRRGQGRGEPAADLDATDLAEAILAHLEGPFVLAKARDEPAVLERLPRDIGRLATR